MAGTALVEARRAGQLPTNLLDPWVPRPCFVSFFGQPESWKVWRGGIPRFRNRGIFVGIFVKKKKEKEI